MLSTRVITIADPSRATPAAAPAFPDEMAFTAWVAQALPGERLVYYHGHLGHDRMPSQKVHPEQTCRKLARLAGRAMALCEDRYILLVQRRLGRGCWAYAAVKSRSAPSPAHLSAALGELLDEEEAA